MLKPLFGTKGAAQQILIIQIPTARNNSFRSGEVVMQIAGSMVKHAEKYAATLEDGSSLRHLRDGIAKALREHEDIRNQIVRSGANQMVLDDWDHTFAEDERRARAALELVLRRLIELRLDPNG